MSKASASARAAPWSSAQNSICKGGVLTGDVDAQAATSSLAEPSVAMVTALHSDMARATASLTSSINPAVSKARGALGISGKAHANNLSSARFVGAEKPRLCAAVAGHAHIKLRPRREHISAHTSGFVVITGELLFGRSEPDRHALYHQEPQTKKGGPRTNNTASKHTPRNKQNDHAFWRLRHHFLNATFLAARCNGSCANCVSKKTQGCTSEVSGMS